MVKKKLSQYLNDKSKRDIKSKYRKVKKAVVDSLLNYDSDQLKQKLRQIGVRSDDTLFVHANFKPDSGYKGQPKDIVQALVEHVGSQGNLLMVSIPFRGTAFDYLQKKKPFRVNRTISMMGMVTETFRRYPGTLRSFHPTHPVLAYGKDAPAIVADHENSVYPCGPDTPFGKFRKMQGKLLFYDVSFGAITFFHYVEDILKDRLPFNIYHEEPLTVSAFDHDDNEQQITTYAFDRTHVRSAAKLEAEMDRQGKLVRAKVGNTNLILVNAEDVVECQSNMVAEGNLPYDL